MSVQERVLPRTVQLAAFDGSEQTVIDIDLEWRRYFAQHVLQRLIALVAAEVRQDLERRRFKEIAIRNGNQIAIDRMQHELAESRSIGEIAALGEHARETCGTFGDGGRFGRQ